MNDAKILGVVSTAIFAVGVGILGGIGIGCVTLGASWLFLASFWGIKYI